MGVENIGMGQAVSVEVIRALSGWDWILFFGVVIVIGASAILVFRRAYGFFTRTIFPKDESTIREVET